MVTTYKVMARHWKHGWELHIDGVGVTQSRSLAEAETVVLDYIETLTGQAADAARVIVTPEVGSGLAEEARAAKEAVAAADRATRAAAARSRKVAHGLKQAGLSGRDIAVILGVSAQRVSQLLKSG